MTVSAAIREEVVARANNRCEYCHMHQSLQGATFHVEHIIPRARGGSDETDNLAWACPGCNLHKANRVEVVDEESGDLIPLFNPRTDSWNSHFRWESLVLVGQTPTGRGTVNALNLNHLRRIQIREAEQLLGLFSP